MTEQETIVTLPKPENGVSFNIKPVGNDIIVVMPGDWKLKKSHKLNFTATKRKWWQFWKNKYYWMGL